LAVRDRDVRILESEPAMATVETLRPEPSAAPTASSIPPADPPERPVAPPLRIGDFRSGRQEDRLAELLAFALAAEARERATDAPGAGGPDAEASPQAEVERCRAQAERELHDHAFRFLHNRVEEIRAEAIAEHHRRVPRPPGFLTLVLANLVTIGLAAAGAGWLHGHPEILESLLGMVGG
jgi:hypothetical protein